MGQCFTDASPLQRDSLCRLRPTSPSSTTESFSPFGLHSSCVSNATKQSLAFVKQQRAKLYIVRRCVTMLLLWHKYGKV
ncbi:unnamed protein product [Sphagnum tenellum]